MSAKPQKHAFSCIGRDAVLSILHWNVCGQASARVRASECLCDAVSLFESNKSGDSCGERHGTNLVTMVLILEPSVWRLRCGWCVGMVELVWREESHAEESSRWTCVQRHRYGVESGGEWDGLAGRGAVTLVHVL